MNSNSLRNIDNLKHILKQTEGDIICFQETHWTDEKKDQVSKIWSGEIFSANGSIKSCGVATLLKKRS